MQRTLDRLSHRSANRMKVYFATAGLLILLGSNAVNCAELPKVPGRQTRQIEGWTVFISDELLDKEKDKTTQSLELLTAQLAEIVRVVPAAARAELQKVPLWISPEYQGTPPRAEYHPAVFWLLLHKRNPAMVKAVEFTNVRIFEREAKRMPNFALHELAHAYHDRVLEKGFENAEIKAVYQRAKDDGLYDHVEQRFGDGRSATVRAYAMTSPQEYFAECSEAFFSTNDFFPFTRDELARHDPMMFDLLKKLWGESTSSKRATAATGDHK
jgi:hypothetical protein